MPNVTIREVPDEVHAVLLARAAEAGQSLQAYLQGLLASAAARPSVHGFAQDLLARAHRRSRHASGQAGDVDSAALIRQDRDGAGGQRP